MNNSSIQVTLPDTQVVDGTLVNITWLSRGLATSELLQISVSGDNGETWTELEASVLNTGTFAWHVAAPVGDEYKVRLTLLKNPAIYGDSGTFSVLAAPTLNPEGGSADKSTKSGADPK